MTDRLTFNLAKNNVFETEYSRQANGSECIYIKTGLYFDSCQVIYESKTIEF